MWNMCSKNASHVYENIYNVVKNVDHVFNFFLSNIWKHTKHVLEQY